MPYRNTAEKQGYNCNKCQKMFWTGKMGMSTLGLPPVWRLAPVSLTFFFFFINMCFLNPYSAIMLQSLMYLSPFYLFRKAIAICCNYSFVLILKRFSESAINWWVSLSYEKSKWQKSLIYKREMWKGAFQDIRSEIIWMFQTPLLQVSNW